MLLTRGCPTAPPTGVHWPRPRRVLFRCSLPRAAHFRERREPGSLISTTSQDTQPRGHERAAQEHDRSADVYEEHAALLDRFGAHRSARTERRHAEEERDAAEAARTP